MNGIKFGNIDYVYALLAIPVVLLLYFLYKQWRKKAHARFGSEKMINRLSSGHSPHKQTLKLVLLLLMLFFVTTGLINPQIGTKLEEGKREGIDIVFALDVSKSMLARDIQPDRLLKSKQLISRIIDQLKNDRIGIVIYAGKAYAQLPITTDYGAAKMFLSTINTDIVPTQGTAIGEAIDLAKQYFDSGGEAERNKMLVVISDGENHEEGAMESAKAIAEEGIIVHTVGVGTLQGGPIPVEVNGRTLGYKKDKQGNTVITKLDETMLRSIAEKGDGEFVYGENTRQVVQFITSKMEEMEKQEFGVKVFSNYQSQFQWFIGIALILLAIDFFITERKSGIMERLFNS